MAGARARSRIGANDRFEESRERSGPALLLALAGKPGKAIEEPRFPVGRFRRGVALAVRFVLGSGVARGRWRWGGRNELVAAIREDQGRRSRNKFTIVIGAHAVLRC